LRPGERLRPGELSHPARWTHILGATSRRKPVLHLSRFQPDTARTAEFLACLWQGSVPESFALREWLYVEVSPRAMVLLWEGDDEAAAYVERNFGGFGVLTTEVVTSATPGLAACLDRDLDGFGAWLAARGSTDDEIARQLDVRRRGLEAASQAEAAAGGRAWAAEEIGA
jgi:hypothetical protein